MSQTAETLSVGDSDVPEIEPQTDGQPEVQTESASSSVDCQLGAIACAGCPLLAACAERKASIESSEDDSEARQPSIKDQLADPETELVLAKPKIVETKQQEVKKPSFEKVDKPIKKQIPAKEIVAKSKTPNRQAVIKQKVEEPTEVRAPALPNANLLNDDANNHAEVVAEESVQQDIQSRPKPKAVQPKSERVVADTKVESADRSDMPKPDHSDTVKKSLPVVEAAGTQVEHSHTSVAEPVSAVITSNLNNDVEIIANTKNKPKEKIDPRHYQPKPEPIQEVKFPEPIVTVDLTVDHKEEVLDITNQDSGEITLSSEPPIEPVDLSKKRHHIKPEPQQQPELVQINEPQLVSEIFEVDQAEIGQDDTLAAPTSLDGQNVAEDPPLEFLGRAQKEAVAIQPELPIEIQNPKLDEVLMMTLQEDVVGSLRQEIEVIFDEIDNDESLNIQPVGTYQNSEVVEHAEPDRAMEIEIAEPIIDSDDSVYSAFNTSLASYFAAIGRDSVRARAILASLALALAFSRKPQLIN